MNQVYSIDKNKKNLEIRFAILRAVREFFWSEKYLEIEAPLIVASPGQEPNIVPMQIIVKDENQKKFFGYLHTSPEYAMKKMLAVGFDRIFYLGKCFRDEESFGGTHNPEFTMIEWYRTKSDIFDLVKEVEKMFRFIIVKLGSRGISSAEAAKNKSFFSKVEKISMKELWHKKVGINLDEYLDQPSMLKLCQARGFKPKKTESYEELFYRIFLNDIESNLGMKHPLVVYGYPREMASLSKIGKDGMYAERFEMYCRGLELANAFTELIDAAEQKKRLQTERSERKKTGKLVFDIDNEFIEALRLGVPPSAGISIGFDRLVMAMTACQNIDDVIVLPMSRIFK